MMGFVGITQELHSRACKGQKEEMNILWSFGGGHL